MIVAELKDAERAVLKINEKKFKMNGKMAAKVLNKRFTGKSIL